MLGLHRKRQTNEVPLLMEPSNTHSDSHHVIEIASSSDVHASTSSHERPSSGSGHRRTEDQPSTSLQVPAYQPPMSNTMNSSLIQRGNSRVRQRSPLNSILWISVELVLTVGQIIAAVLVLSLSKNENPHAPLKAWIIGYVSGCCAILPLLYWRFIYRNVGYEQDIPQLHQESSQGSNNAGLVNRRVAEREDGQTTGTATGGTQTTGLPNPRLKAFVQYFKMLLDCFFAIWFVVGNVWLFGGQSSAAEAPNMYRLCIVFLAFSCIGYAMPFILCTTICCCLPCIIAIMGFQEDSPQTRGATQESINALPTYKFKVKKNTGSGNDKENSSGGIVGAGTKHERVISEEEDAECCICLAEYSNNDELRELPCTHFFHKNCVDKWLKINASCPLCKTEVGKTETSPVTETSASAQNTNDG